MKSLQSKPRSRRHRLLGIEKLELRSMLAAAPITDHGLTGTYFDNVDLSGSSVTRIDPFVDFDFGQGSPAAGIDSDTFSARWTGRLSAPYTESYTFSTRSDNGVRLWVNNTLVINNWTSHLETENASPSLPLVAGQSYDIKLEYFDDTGRATIRLLWASDSTPKVVVPSENLKPLSPPAPAGQLLLETFSNIAGDNVANLTSNAAFPSSPSASEYVTTFEAPSNRGDNFGSRVRGYVVAPETGDYTFWISGDNEAQLFLSNDQSPENKRLIATSPASGTSSPNDWNHFASQRSQPIRLLAGDRYYIEALHKEGTASDHLAVGWELPSGTWERPIPASRLLPILPEVRLFTGSPSTHESTSAPATLTVVRDDDFGRDLTVRYFLGGTASNGVDYAALSGAVVIPRGQRSAQITIAPVADGLAENQETIVVMLAPSQDYVLGPPSTMTATATITDGVPLAGGTNQLAGNPLTNVGFSGGQYATRQVVNVSGMPFAQALQVTTNTLAPNVWDIQLRWNNAAAIQANDTLFATFWLRNADATKPEANVDIVFEMNGEPWTKSLAHVATAGTEWTRVDLPFSAAAAYAPNGAAFALRFGYKPQTVQIGGLAVTDYGSAVSVSSLPQTQTSYPGHEGTAAWRDEADARIDEIRKAPLTVTVKDSAGNVLEGAKVEIVLRQHEFGFGSAIAANPVLNNNTVDGSRYRALVKSLYSRVVVENALKWPNWQSARQTGINLVNWLVNAGLEVRGHNLVWPNWQWLPSSLKSTYGSKVATEGQVAATAWLRQTVIDHIADEVGALAGKLVEWDVINEPYNNHELMDILGNSAMIDWFKRADQSDPNSRMFVNDYSILSGRGADYAHQDGYFNTIQYLLAGGAPLEGIGMQGHFGSGLTGVPRMLEILDRFATFGLPIEATEFDVDVPDEQVQADFLRDFMTTLFSHPAVNGILMWGFWQNAHWLPQAALYRSDWTIKPNGQAWLDLVHSLWTTETTGTTLPDGTYGTRGFLGDYEIKVSFAGQTKTVLATLVTGGTSLEVALDGTLNWEPRNLTAIATQPDAVDVSWTASGVAVLGYTIERQRPGEAWAVVGSVSPNTLAFTDINVAPDTTYNYRVRAVKAGPIWSDYSNVATANTPPKSFEGTSGDDNLTLRASSDRAMLEIYNGNPPAPGSMPILKWPMNASVSLLMYTQGGNDSITIELPDGTSGPTQGIRLDVGSGSNQLRIVSGQIRIDSTTTGGTLDTTVQTGAHLSTSRFVQNSLSLADNSEATLIAGGQPSLLTSLTIGTGARLDVTDNALVIDYTGTSPAATIRDQILSGRGGAGLGQGWIGTGITSSTAAQTNVTVPESRSVGYAENALLPLGAYGSFRGVAVDDTSVLITYTRTGDANLDGFVNNNDVTILGANYAPGVSKPAWALGDFEYDGFVSNDDVTVLGAFYNPAAAPAPAPANEVRDEVVSGELVAAEGSTEGVVSRSARSTVTMSRDHGTPKTEGLFAASALTETFGPTLVSVGETRANPSTRAPRQTDQHKQLSRHAVSESLMTLIADAVTSSQERLASAPPLMGRHTRSTNDLWVNGPWFL